MENAAEIGIIGGSGLYEMEGLSEVRELEVSTPFGAPSDKLILGKLEGQRVAFLPRHARGHRIMSSEINFQANSFALKTLVVQWIFSVSAWAPSRKIRAAADGHPRSIRGSPARGKRLPARS